MIRVQEADFDVGAEIAALTRGRTGIGGIAVFIGLVRDFVAAGAGDGDAGIASMTLEHYPGMTEKMLARIEDEANARWRLEASLIVHRVGTLRPGDNIVLVACAAAHREAALQACAFLIDWLKTKAPFWKKEETGGEERWVRARAGDEAMARRWEESGRR